MCTSSRVSACSISLGAMLQSDKHATLFKVFFFSSFGGGGAENRAKGPGNKNVSKTQTFGGYMCVRLLKETVPEEVRCLSDLGEKHKC